MTDPIYRFHLKYLKKTILLKIGDSIQSLKIHPQVN
jgi:hypothetical protein